MNLFIPFSLFIFVATCLGRPNAPSVSRKLQPVITIDLFVSILNKKKSPNSLAGECPKCRKYCSQLRGDVPHGPLSPRGCLRRLRPRYSTRLRCRSFPGCMVPYRDQPTGLGSERVTIQLSGGRGVGAGASSGLNPNVISHQLQEVAASVQHVVSLQREVEGPIGGWVKRNIDFLTTKRFSPLPLP